VRLTVDDDAVALTTIDHVVAPSESSIAAIAAATPVEIIEAKLAEAASPLSATSLRKLCRLRNATVTAALTELISAGRVRKQATGYTVVR
jgi:hypothetical protein